jgi:hypothetical protein
MRILRRHCAIRGGFDRAREMAKPIVAALVKPAVTTCCDAWRCDSSLAFAFASFSHLFQLRAAANARPVRQDHLVLPDQPVSSALPALRVRKVRALAAKKAQGVTSAIRAI